VRPSLAAKYSDVIAKYFASNVSMRLHNTGIHALKVARNLH